MPRDLHYGWPSAAYLMVIAFLILGCFFLLYRYRKSWLEMFSLSSNTRARSSMLFAVASGCYAFAWVCAAAALMMPEGNGHYPEGALPKAPGASHQQAKLKRKAHDVVLLLDASASMGTKDTRTGQSRLDYAKNVGDEIISQLQGENVSLYAFTSQLTPLSPPTLDYLFARLMLKEAQINEGGIAGTNFAAALGELRQRLMQEPLEELKTIIILSDGGDTLAESLSGEERQREIDAIAQLMADGKNWNMRLYSIGFGSQKGGAVPNMTYEGHSVITVLDKSVLEKLSRVGRGEFYVADDYSVLAIATEIIRQIEAADPPIEERQADPQLLKLLAKDDDLIYDAYYQIPLGVCIIVLLLALYLPKVKFGKSGWLLLLAVMPLEGTVLEANRLFEAGLYDEAIHVLQDDAEASIATWQSAALLYDGGTVKLVKGDVDQAIGALASIPLSDGPSPVLVMHLKTNLGIAYLLKAATVPPPQAAVLYRAAERSFEQADKARCRMKELATVCWTEGNLPALRDIAKIDLAHVISQKIDYQDVNISFREGVTLLKEGVGNARQLASLPEGAIDDKWQGGYAALYDSEWHSWLSLWDALAKRNDDSHFAAAHQDYLTAQAFVTAKASLEAALKELDLVIFPDSEKTSTGEQLSAVALLKRAIDFQEQAIRLYETVQMALSEGESPAEWKVQLQEAQQSALNAAESFPDLVMKQQVAAFRGQKEPRCQARPWNEALPLFDEGLRAAREGQKILEDKQRSALALQEKALASWVKAYEMLQRPVDPRGGGCQGGGGGESDKKNKNEKHATFPPTH